MPSPRNVNVRIFLIEKTLKCLFNTDELCNYVKTLSLSYPGTSNTYHYEKKIKTVMVNNSTNINKTNNHLSPQVIKHKKKTQIMYITLEIQVLAWDSQNIWEGGGRGRSRDIKQDYRI